MESNRLLNDNYIKINHIAAKCMRIFAALIVALWIFASFSGECDMIVVTICMLICCIISLLPTFVIDIFKHDRNQSVKYIVIILAVINCIILNSVLSHMAIMVWIFPILLTSLYYNKTLVLFTALLSTIGIMLANFANIEFYYVTVPPMYDNYTDCMVLSVFPCVLTVIILSFVAYFIVSRNSIMLTEAVDNAEEVKNNQKELIFAFAELSESKSKSTGEHIKRVSEYMRVLGKASGFDEDYVDKLSTAAMMHDIGKLMISEEILDKPSKLTDEEFAIMKSHVLYADALLEKCPGEIMQIARTIAKEHHEKWDGTGYLGMKGEEIAYISRLMAVCDVFDALTSKRYYKRGWTVEEAYNEIVSLSGKHFDPQVVELFKEHFDEFKEIVEKQPDKQVY